MEDRTYVSGRMLRSEAAMVVINLCVNWIERQKDSERLKSTLADDGR